MILNHPCTIETEQNCIRRVMSDFIVPPSGWHNATPTGPLWAYTFSSGTKRAQGGHPAPPALQDTFQKTHSGLAPQEPLEECVGLKHWESDRDRERDRIYRLQFSDLGRPHSCFQRHLNRNPNYGSAYFEVVNHTCFGAHSILLPGQGNKFTVPPNY